MMYSWRDIEDLDPTDCPLCGGAGFYEVLFIIEVTSKRKRVRRVIDTRIYGTGFGDLQGYRVLTRCHLCDAAFNRGVPDDVGCWKDGQPDSLVRAREWNGDPRF